MDLSSIQTAMTNWSADGRNQFEELYKKLIEQDHQRYEAEIAVKQLLLALCKSCLQGNQSVETVIRIFADLQDLVAVPMLIGELLADLLATLDIELFPTDDSTSKETYKQRFFQLINNSEHIIATSLLMERLEIETLEYLDLIVSRDQFNQKYVRIKTRLYYKQQKFNLLREESEGFAKAITELNQNFSMTKVSSKQLYDRLMALIGYFDIDPNRMLDLVLESFEYHFQYTKIYVDLLELLHFDRSTLCQLIGFKFQQYQLQDDTPQSLYLLVAQLIVHRLIQTEDLLTHLYPLVNDFTDQYNRALENARSAKKSSDSINKTASIKTNHQLLHLILALLEIGGLEHVLFLFNHLPRWSCTSHREINTLLSRILAYQIDSFYKSHTDFHSSFLQYELKNPLNEQLYPQQLIVVDNWNDFREKIFSLLLHLGSFCQDRHLFTKLIRLATHLMKQSSSDEYQEDILLLIDEVLFPSLTLLDVNGCLAIELWSLMKLFPFDIRYALYGQWHEETYRKTIPLINMKHEVNEKTRAILRRITKDNVKTYSRQIAKMTHNNPIVILTVIVDQIQRFDNFIAVINDALKYLSPLAYDILCYTILRALTVPVSPTSLPTYIDGKMSRENATPAQWFQNLCVLSANVFKKYPIDFASILHYIYDQLRAEKTCDLYLLREIITKMGGLEVSSTLTTEQLEAASGGELLRNEAAQFTAARNVKKPSIRLKEALLDNHLYLPLSIIIAQQRSCIVFKFGAQRIEHLKLIGSLYDQCQDTMVQFFTFLSNVLTTENFHHRFPSIDDLVLGFHLQVDAAFHISRPLFNLNIQAKFDELRSATPQSSTSKKLLIQNYIDAVNIVMSPVLDFVKTLHPQRTWEEMTPQFYLTFWSLSMSDLQVPKMAYERQITRLEQEMNQIEERKDLTAGKKRKEKEKLHVIINKLGEELSKQIEHVERVRARLEIERENWFKNRHKTKAETITEFLQLCIFPRCLLSEIDALYCAHFIRVIHDLVTPNFSTIICYDRLFSDISYSLASCSENEAIRYGRFLQCLLETVMSWHSDKNKFEKDCASHPGFLTVFRNAGSATTRTSGTTQTPEQLDYDNFRHVCHKWHYKLAKSFIVCLESTDYIQIRNVLQVLTILLPIYPKMKAFYAALERRIRAICDAEKDQRHDLFALAKCYSGRLAHKHKDMIEESQFHNVPERPAPVAATSSAADSTPPSSSSSSSSSSNSRPTSGNSTTNRQTNDNKANVSNGDGKDSSPAPTRSGSSSLTSTERSKVKVESANSTGSPSTTTTTTTSTTNSNSTAPSSTTTNIGSRTLETTSGPSPKPSSSAPVKTENKDASPVPPSSGGRTIKLMNTANESSQNSSSSSRDSPPSTKKESSSSSDRRPTSTNVETSKKATSSSSTRTVTPSSRTNAATSSSNNEESSRRTDATTNNGNNPSSSTTSKTTRTGSPQEHVPGKRVRSGSSKTDRNPTSHSDDTRNGSSSRSGHREHKSESTKRNRSTTPDKKTSNGSSGNSSSSRRSAQAAPESTTSTTPVHADNDHSGGSGSGMTDISPSSKRIKTTDSVSNGRTTRREGREERHGSSSSSSHRVSSSSSRSERREKHHASKDSK